MSNLDTWIRVVLTWNAVAWLLVLGANQAPPPTSDFDLAALHVLRTCAGLGVIVLAVTLVWVVGS